MISKQEISGASVGDAANYYDKAFAADGNVHSADNYYVNEQAQALWHGQGAELLGLHGQKVTKEQFIELLNGKVLNPATGKMQDLSKNGNGLERRAGIDFTITPSKSVSIAALAPGGDKRIVDAHLRANQKAMATFEKYGAAIRTGKGEHVFTKNLVYASVMHETNRTNEPNLHSHNVVSALTYDHENKKWRSLTNDHLYHMRATVDMIYKRELAQELISLGYQLEYGKNGDFEIKGIDREIVKAFSTRTADKEAKLKSWGIDIEDADYAQRQSAVLATRTAKSEFTRDVLDKLWGDRLSELNLDLAKIVPAPERAVEAQQKRSSVEQQNHLALNAVSWGVKHLTTREQAFKRIELVREALRFSDARVSVDAIMNAIDHQIRNEQIIEKAGERGNTYTTVQAMTAERSFLQRINDGKERSNVKLTQVEFDQYLQQYHELKSAETGTNYKLSYEQVNASWNVLLHGDQFQAIQGDAGTGKTAALAFINHVAKEKGWEVIGMATSASAAQQLQRDSGIPSSTVARFLVKHENQIKLLESELQSLKNALAQEPSFNPADNKRVTIERMPSAAGKNLESRYVIDHQTGAVYKTPNDLSHRLGYKLVDRAQENLPKIEQAIKEADTFAKKQFADLKLKINTAGSALGKHLTNYERITLNSGYKRVGDSEEIAVKTAMMERTELGRSYIQKEAQLINLKNTGNIEGKKVLIIMDESSMTGVADMEKISALAEKINAKAIFQGDTKQHASVAAGKAFEQMQTMKANTSVILETRRFNEATPQTKKAISLMKKDRYKEAIEVLDTTKVERNHLLASATAQRFWENLQDLRSKGIDQPMVGVVTATNADRKEINTEISLLLRGQGIIDKEKYIKAHLDDAKITDIEQRYAAVLKDKNIDQIVFRQNYKEIGVSQGDAFKVVDFDIGKNRVIAINDDGKKISFNPKQQDRFDSRVLEDREYSVGHEVEARSILKLDNKIEIANGSQGKITAIDGHGATIKWGADGLETKLNNEQIKNLDLAYARTTYKEQGATNHVEIWAVSTTGAKVYDRAAQYVALTRAKHNIEIVTSSYETLLSRAGKAIDKSTAYEVAYSKDAVALQVDRVSKIAQKEKMAVQEKEQTIGFRR